MDRIPKRAYLGDHSLSSFTIPQSVHEIEDWAFARCRNLKSITIESDSLHLGKGVFYQTVEVSRIYTRKMLEQAASDKDAETLAILLAFGVCRMEADYLLHLDEVGSKEWFQSLDARLLTVLKESQESALKDLVYVPEEVMSDKQKQCLLEARKYKSRCALHRLSFPLELEIPVRQEVIAFLEQELAHKEESVIWGLLSEETEFGLAYAETLLEHKLLAAELRAEFLTWLSPDAVELRTYFLSHGNSATEDSAAGDGFALFEMLEQI